MRTFFFPVNFCNLEATANEVISKYNHHSWQVIIMPTMQNAIIFQLIVREDAAIPIATIDSPKAIIITSPYRSEKCPIEVNSQSDQENKVPR